MALRGGTHVRIAAPLLLFCSAPALADEAPGTCEIYHESPTGFIAIEPTGGSRDGVDFYSLRLTSDDVLVGADGTTSSFELFGIFSGSLTPERVPEVLDSMVVELNFGDAQAVDAPAMIYYTRDNTIPLDVAPGKLWYPRYSLRHDTLQILVTFGDLERHMDFGPEFGSAEVLSWIVKKVGTGLYDDDLIASGEIPLAPIRAALGETEAALQRWLEEHDPAAC